MTYAALHQGGSPAHLNVNDPFWNDEMELVRSTVIPYQWELLNDRVPGAAPSFCMRNFRTAARMNREKARQGAEYVAPKYTFRGFEALPEDPEHPDDDKFYGFVFQDSDFYKWIEAVGYSLARQPDAALEKTADEAIDLVCSAQQENGYLDTYYIINGLDRVFTNLRDNHELYCFGHLAEGAVAYWQGTGKDKLLHAACRYADYIYARFNDETGDCKGYPGHEIAEMALFRLFEATGTERYRELAMLFLNRRGQRPYYFDSEDHVQKPAALGELRHQYHQAHLPVRLQREAVGHAVRAVYLYSGMTDAARLTGDAEMKKACRALWEDVTRRKMYVTGGIGSTAEGEAFTFAYDLPNDTAYAETCAAIGLVFWARRMLQIAPRAEYADVMERALYNGVLSGMAADGKSFFYVNPLEVVPAACHGDPRKSHVKPVRQKWFGCACCPPNLVRLVSSIGEYACTRAEHCLFVHLYLGGETVCHSDGREIRVQITSGMPWAGKASLRVAGCGGKPFTLALRIPEWCAGHYTVAGAQEADRTEKDGYLYLSKAWTEGETLALEFEMAPRLIAADPRMRADAGMVCAVRGPMVYCMEQADNGMDLCHRRIFTKFPLAESFETILPGHTVPVLTARGQKVLSEFPAAPDAAATLYAPYRAPRTQDCTLKLIPYYLWANRGEGEMRVWLEAED